MKVMLHWLEDLDSSYFEEAELSNVRVRGCDLFFWGEGGTKIGEHMVTVVQPFRHRYFIDFYSTITSCNLFFCISPISGKAG